MPINLGSLGQLARPTMAGPGGAMAPPRAPMAMPQRPMMAPPQAPVMQRDPGVGRNPGLPMMPQRDTGMGNGPGRAMAPRPVSPVMRKRGGPSNLTPQERAILHYWQGGAVHMATGGDPRAAMGRRGDTELAHVNPTEQRLLKTLGGAGTINPKTGLREFYSDSANEHSRADTGHNMSDHSRPGGSVGGNGGGGNVGGGPMGNATVADKKVMDKYIADPNEKIANEAEYNKAINNLGQRFNDFKNTGNTTIDNLGNAIAGIASIGEIDPTRQALGASTESPRASWGVDPIGLAASIAGTVLGMPIGSTYALGKKITGWQGPSIAFDGFNPQSQFSNDVTSPQVTRNGGGSSPGGSGASHTGGGKGGDGSGQQNVGASPQVISSLGAAATNHPRDPGVGNGADTPPAIDPVTGQEFDPYTGDPLHYGEAGPEHNFWPHGMIPVTSAATGGPISGPGDGQSDDIPAMLSNNEHVVDASTVALAGRGDSKAGHAAIEKWKQDVRRKAGMKNPKKAPLMSIGQLGKAA